MKTKTIQIGGVQFVIAKLTLDDVETWETETRALKDKAVSLKEVYAVQRKAVAASVARAGVTDPKAVGALDVDGLSELVHEVMTFSHMVGGSPGEAGSP